MAKDYPETNPITIKPETASHVAQQFSWVPLPYCSLPGRPFAIKSLALSAHESPRIIHFQVLDKSPVSGPGRGPPSCNTSESGWKELVGQYTTLVGQLEYSLQIVSTISQTFALITEDAGCLGSSL